MASCRNKRLCLLLVLFAALGATVLWAVLRKTDLFKSPKSAPVKTVKKKTTKSKSTKKKLDSAVVATELHKMSGGKRVKAVWVESRDRAKTDTFLRGTDLHLTGFDSAANEVKTFGDGGQNFSRPLITPDGKQIIYTDNGATVVGKSVTFHPTIHVIDWETEMDTAIGAGFCVDVVLDPVSGKTWIYALESINPKFQTAIDGENLFRFDLEKPEEIQPLWNKATLTIDNLQVSRDGKRFAGQFPWPEGGWVDLASNSMQKFGNGCWTSFAPDNSYIAWLFAGNHKQIAFIDPASGRTWNVPLNLAPGVNKHQVYHPRWSNHPQFFAMTGPYPALTVKKGQPNAGNPIHTSGAYAEVFIGKFSPKLDKVESWVQLTSNRHGDFYPDVWIEDGDTAELKEFAQSAPPKFATKAKPWPGDTKELLFVWNDLMATNQIEGRHMTCRAIGRGIGRFGRLNDMILDGGYFETEEETTAALRSQLPKAGALTWEFLLSEPSIFPEAQHARVAALVHDSGEPILEIVREQEALIVKLPAGKFSSQAVQHKSELRYRGGNARHLALRVEGRKIELFVEGASVGQRESSADFNFKALADVKLIFGEKRPVPLGWQMRVQNVAVYAKSLQDAVIKEHFNSSHADLISPAPGLRLKAKLIAATVPDPEQLGSYQRMLVDHTYEVTKVLSGSYEAKTVVVLHWAILDRKIVAGMPREVGKEYELYLEPVAAHTELTSELQVTESEDFEASVFHDVSTPSLQE